MDDGGGLIGAAPAAPLFERFVAHGGPALGGLGDGSGVDPPQEPQVGQLIRGRSGAAFMVGVLNEGRDTVAREEEPSSV